MISKKIQNIHISEIKMSLYNQYSKIDDGCEICFEKNKEIILEECYQCLRNQLALEKEKVKQLSAIIKNDR